MKNNSLPLVRQAGFSLVEVTLALAILAVGLLTILGLFPQGLEAGRNAADNTVVATIVQDIFSEIRSYPFNQVNLTGSKIDLSTDTGPDTMYFDKIGSNVVSTSPVRYFKLAIAYAPQAPLALSQIKAEVVWPALAYTTPTAVVQPANTNIFITNVAWYDQ